MPLSTDVRIGGRLHLHFPERCVACDKPGMVQMLELRGYPASVLDVFRWIVGRTKQLRVPVHRECGVRLRRTLLRRVASLLVLTSLGVTLALMLNLEGWWAKLAIVSLAFAGVLWQVTRPAAFEFKHHGDQFTLHFRNAEYASEVARLNDVELDSS